MGIASMVLGIISILIAWIPFCGFIVTLPALIGISLGIAFLIGAKKSGDPNGVGIAGVILNGLSLLILLAYLLLPLLASPMVNTISQSPQGQRLTEQIDSVRDSIAREIEKEFQSIPEEQ